MTATSFPFTTITTGLTPLKWSQDLAKALKDKDKDVQLFVYPGADHNLLGAWDTAVQRDILWFNTH